MSSPTHRTTANVLRLRSSATFGNNIIAKLPQGTAIHALPNPNGSWRRVRAILRDGEQTGWVSSDFLEPIGATVPPHIVEPGWLTFARAEIGIREYPGPQHNPRIIEYLKSTTNPASSDETPWCAAFVNWCMKQAGMPRLNSAAARDWLTWGRRLNAPEYGCLVVFDRSDPGNPSAAHVGFYLETTGTGLQILGGNQSNKVCVASYATGRVLDYRTS